MKGRSKLLTWGLPLVGAVALFGGAGLVIANRPFHPQEDPPRRPTTAPAEVDASRFVGAVGVSEPPGEAITVGAHVGGLVSSVEVRAGDAVDEGAVLFTVDRRAARSAVAQREALLDVARADLDALAAQIPVRRADVEAASARVLAAEARAAQLDAQLADRRNQLRIAESVDDPRAISTEEVDRRRFAVQAAEAQLADARAGVVEARAAVAQAEAQLALLVDGEGGDEDGPDLRASAQRVERAVRELEQARVDLELHTVRAPVDADVLRVRIRPGEFAPAASVTDGLVVLGRRGPTHLRVEIDEVDIPRIAPSARAWASPRGDASVRLPLEVDLVEPLLVPKTNLAGRTSELVDVRVLQIVYRFLEEPGPGLGRLFDVYIEASGEDA